MSLMDEYAAWKAGLTEAVETALLTHVAPAVKEEMRAQVYEKVYDAYEPKLYERRYDEDGLGDIRNYEASVDVGTMTLTVENLTRDDGYWRPDGAPDRFLAPVVESGSGYDYFSPGPRPFNEATEKEVVRDGSVERELADGLREQGYDVREV